MWHEGAHQGRPYITSIFAGAALWSPWIGEPRPVSSAPVGRRPLASKNIENNPMQSSPAVADMRDPAKTF